MSEAGLQVSGEKCAMMKLFSLATGLLLVLASPWVAALEMGELIARSRLGQPFVGEIRLQGEFYSQISPDCVRLVDPRQADGLPGLPPGVRIEYVSNAQGGVLRLLSRQKVLDPALQVAVFIGCGVNLQRDYAVLLDLPGQPETGSDAASASPSPASPSTATTSRPRAAQAARLLRPARAQAAAVPRTVSARMPAAPATPAVAAAATPSPAAPTQPATETPPPQVSAPPVAPAAPPPAAVAPAAAQPAAEAPNDPLITAGLILLIALLLLGIWYQHRRNIRAAAQEDYAHGDMPPTENTFLSRPLPATPPPPPTRQEASAPRARADDEDEMPILPASASGEYLMDLTDVMLSFGETQRALKALHEFVHEHPDDAVAPWLRLLDLLRTHGKREEFQALAIKLHQVFNIATPQWEESQSASAPVAGAPAPASMDSLEDFTHIRQRLVDTWGTPEGLKYLDILMRDNRAGQRRGFPLQIAEEVILLRDILALRMNNT